MPTVKMPHCQEGKQHGFNHQVPQALGPDTAREYKREENLRLGTTTIAPRTMTRAHIRVEQGSGSPSLTICRPRATAACTFLREPSFSSNTSADQMAQLTCVHSFCPMYRSRPASCRKEWVGGVCVCKNTQNHHPPLRLHTHSSPHLGVCIPILEAERTLTGVIHV